MTEIYLVRHAEAEGNAYRRIHGQYDSRVTENGLQQIAALETELARAREHSLGRGEHETAMEFVDRLAEEVPALEAEATRLDELRAQSDRARPGPLRRLAVARADAEAKGASRDPVYAVERAVLTICNARRAGSRRR